MIPISRKRTERLVPGTPYLTPKKLSMVSPELVPNSEKIKYGVPGTGKYGVPGTGKIKYGVPGTGKKIKYGVPGTGMVSPELAGRSPGRRGRLVTLSPPGCLTRLDGPVADDTEQPGRRVVRQRALSRQLQKRILNHVFRHVAPLPREQFERGGVLVQEVAEQVRIHAISASPVLVCLSLG